MLYKPQFTNQKGVGRDLKHISTQLPYRESLRLKYICKDVGIHIRRFIFMGL